MRPWDVAQARAHDRIAGMEVLVSGHGRLRHARGIASCLLSKVPLVTGTTEWSSRSSLVTKIVESGGGTMFHCFDFADAGVEAPQGAVRVAEWLVGGHGVFSLAELPEDLLR